MFCDSSWHQTKLRAFGNCATVALIYAGQSNQEIAETLERSVNTVKSELHAVFKKLGIPSRARLMALLR